MLRALPTGTLPFPRRSRPGPIYCSPSRSKKFVCTCKWAREALHSSKPSPHCQLKLPSPSRSLRLILNPQQTGITLTVGARECLAALKPSGRRAKRRLTFRNLPALQATDGGRKRSRAWPRMVGDAMGPQGGPLAHMLLPAAATAALHSRPNRSAATNLRRCRLRRQPSATAAAWTHTRRPACPTAWRAV